MSDVANNLDRGSNAQDVKEAFTRDLSAKEHRSRVTRIVTWIKRAGLPASIDAFADACRRASVQLADHELGNVAEQLRIMKEESHFGE